MLSKPLGRIVAGLVVVVIVVVVWFALQVDPIFGGKGKNVVVVIPAETSLSSITSELQSHGVISSGIAFHLDTALFGNFQVSEGAYQIAKGSSYSRVRSVFGTTPNVAVIDVTAGLSLREVAVDVADAKGNSFGDAFVHAATASFTPSPYLASGSLEGLIGTGDYLITPNESADHLVTLMVKRFASQAASVGLTPTTTLNGLDAYELIIAASIVEKEGYYPVNMPQVARVIYNRLARGGPLQMDATVLYYLGKDGGTVTPAMLQTQEPYNTYLNVGLTPTPICAISTIAMHATLHAPAGTWLYFTLINEDGQMAFSTTFAQQLKEEALAQSRGIG